ncbi:sialate O-acetylesterase [Terriglobus sp. 2YAB30_2]|uniref:sialate O-acetylesterase n=1 Tax=Terriglobus sp. 2YAB30_2 TaxID=3233023 RepID=UPI003F982331
MNRNALLSFALLSIGSLSAAAEVRLPNVLSDHAVLQRSRPIHIWGTGAAQESVTVTFHGQTATATANADGNWELWLRPEEAGGPYELTVTGSQSSAPLKRSDLLIGDVWFASGQSNMEFPLKGFTGAPLLNGDKEIAAATQPKIRLLRERHRTSATILNEAEDTWTLCTPETAKDFSAVGYLFSRELTQEEHVPIGVIDSTWGGTPAHAWTSAEGIGYANLPSVAADAGKIAIDQGRIDSLKARYAAEDEALKAAGKEVPTRPRIANDHLGSWAPASLYNGMVAPFTKLTIKGVIWYQGETDTAPERAPYYARVFPAMIQDWRRQWGQGTFFFLYVQISNFGHVNEGWGQVREAQRRTLELGQTGMAVTLDVGNHDNVHPSDKQTVAHRLALIARESVYGEKLQGESPTFTQATQEDGAMRVWLAHATGLRSEMNPLTEFEVAGEDHKFSPAEATIDGETIVVKAAAVATPRYVRYAWNGGVDCYVYNGKGLPLGTFTSER